MTVSKSRVAFYAFGDSSRQADVDTIVIKDAEILLKNELNQKRAGLGDTANLTHNLLELAACYFACYLMAKAGVAIDRSGVVSSESIDGMSISYESVGQRQIKTNNPPLDFKGMAMDMVNRYAEETILEHRGIGVVVKNYRGKILNGFYDKYNENYRHGVP